jgi:hypothetical protein
MMESIKSKPEREQKDSKMYVHTHADRNKIPTASQSVIPATTGLVIFSAFFVALLALLLPALFWLAASLTQAGGEWAACKLQLALIIAGGMSLVGLWRGVARFWKSRRSFQRLEREGCFSQGVISDLWTEININDHTRPMFMAAFRFDADDPKTRLPAHYQAKEEITETFFTHAALQKQVRIRYLQENPVVCRLDLDGPFEQ